MKDLLMFFSTFDKDSPHHIAAVHMLSRSMPKELLNEDSDWIACWKEQEFEWKYNK